MTGPEHYRTAEVLLRNLRAEVAGASGTPLYTPEHQARIIAEAQVHATLALAAATAGPASRAHLTEVEGESAARAWTQATS